MLIETLKSLFTRMKKISNYWLISRHSQVFLGPMDTQYKVVIQRLSERRKVYRRKAIVDEKCYFLHDTTDLVIVELVGLLSFSK